MTSSPFLVKAGSGLSPVDAGLSLTLVFPLPLPFSTGRDERGIHLFEGEFCSHNEEPLELWSSLVRSCCDLFHFPGSKKCKLVHCFINTVSVTVRVFLIRFFFFLFYPPVTRNCKCSGKEEGL